jgi:hypothetical protein
MFINHTLGCNAINASKSDGLTSGFIDQLGWETAFCYYVTDIRNLEIEKDVPKSVSIVGQSVCGKEMDIQCFLIYQSEILIDCLSGATV